MKVGFIGAGKAGCSLGKYFASKTLPDLTLAGYYSRKSEDAQWAAAFTRSQHFTSLEDVVSASDTIIIATQDSVVDFVWKTIPKEALKGKIIAHLSGSLSTDVFSERESYHIHGISIHPLFAFSNKESVYKQLHNVCFTLEGDSFAVECWQNIFSALGNPTLQIHKADKVKYHAAASLLSNHILAVLDSGYQLLAECGFDACQARQFTAALVSANVTHALEQGPVNALTGPIERGDTDTVRKHLAIMSENTKDIYCSCGMGLLTLAQCRHPEKDYSSIRELLKIVR